MARLIVDSSHFMTILDVAGWFDLSWNTVKEVVKASLEKDYKRIGYRKVKQIGIDELYIGKKHKFITLVTDLESGRIIWVGMGRGSNALREFWRRFKISGARLQAVAMDMSGAYALSVREHAPHAILTFDRFHVIKLMNERLDDIRRELVRKTEDKEGQKAVKGLRWLLLSRPAKLRASAKEKLDAALALNGPLSVAYLLKEELGLLWEQADGRQAWNFMRAWCAKAKASKIPQLVAMTKTLLRHARGILSYYKTRITSGIVEGINRKIRGLLCAAYGIRDIAFLKLRLYALHESKFKFIG